MGEPKKRNMESRNISDDGEFEDLPALTDGSETSCDEISDDEDFKSVQSEPPDDKDNPESDSVNAKPKRKDSFKGIVDAEQLETLKAVLKANLEPVKQEKKTVHDTAASEAEAKSDESPDSHAQSLQQLDVERAQKSKAEIDKALKANSEILKQQEKIAHDMVAALHALERAQKSKVEMEKLQQHLSDKRKASEEALAARKERVQELKDERIKLDKDITDVSKYSNIERQRAMTESKHWKSESDDLEEALNTVKFNLGVKKGEMEKLKGDALRLKRANREFEEIIKRGKSCSCKNDALLEEYRAVAAEVTLLRVQQEVELRPLERTYNDAVEVISRLANEVNKTTPSERLKYQDKWSKYKDHTQATITNIGHQFNGLIGLVESGMPLDSLQKVDIPQPMDEPSLPPNFKNEFQPPEELWAKRIPSGSSIHSSASSQMVMNRNLDIQPINQSVVASPSTSSPDLGGNAMRIPATGFESGVKVPNENAQNAANIQPIGLVPVGKKPDATGEKLKVEKLVDAVVAKAPAFTKDQVKIALVEFRNKNGSFRNIASDRLVTQVCDILKEIYGGNNNDDMECMICHEKLANGPTFKMDCDHEGHSKCLRFWFEQGKSCPICENY